MVISIRKPERNEFYQYILIYILIQYIGGRLLAAVGSDIFYSFTILLCVFVMLYCGIITQISKRWFLGVLAIFCSCCITYAVTAGGLSIGTILSILSRFLLIYVAIKLDSQNFLLRFLKIVYMMAIISLIEFAFVQIVGEGTALSVFSRLYEVSNGNEYLGNSYGLFIVCYNFMDAARNAYMFGEPGEYQSLLITALYFLAFFDLPIDSKQKTKYYVVFLITLLSTQSTTGYFNLIAFVFAVLIDNREKMSPLIKRITGVSVAIFTGYMLFFYSEDSFIYRNFVYKITNDSGDIDLATNTGVARVGPTMRFLQTVKEVPEKLIFGVGYDGLESLPLGGYSTCGLINSVCMIGIISSLILYGWMFAGLVQSSHSKVQMILGIFLVINMGISQPDILAIMSVLICMYGWIMRECEDEERQGDSLDPYFNDM